MRQIHRPCGSPHERTLIVKPALHMATALHPLSIYDPDTVPSATAYRFAVVVSEWNTAITSALASGCIKTLEKHGAKAIEVFHVPGSFELSSAAGKLADTGRFDAIICLGCVIQGETRHFDFICEAVANGLTQVGIQYKVPAIFGVLTTQNQAQAEARSGGALGNKGVEAAVTAIKMAAFFGQADDLKA